MIVREPLTLLEVLEDRLLIGDGCWNWTGYTDKDGYGRIHMGGSREKGGKNVRMHRVMYEEFVGPIPGDLTIDHLCRNRACLKPSHMEVVTRSENGKRSHQ